VDGAPPLGWDDRAVLALSHVYGAALAATAEPADAADVTQQVMVAAARDRADTRTLVARAVLRAMRTAPHAAFACMAPSEREVVALARLAGYTVPEIAATLGIEPAEARARMTRALRAAAVT
jgi:DNA-directed RNA polymerase specialized sigma24 family protein